MGSPSSSPLIPFFPLLFPLFPLIFPLLPPGHKTVPGLDERGLPRQSGNVFLLIARNQRERNPNMIPIWKMIRSIYHLTTYIWVTVTIITETPKAVLINHNNRTVWLPKAWIVSTKPGHLPLRVRKAADLSAEAKHDKYLAKAETISIKITEYHWARRFG